MRYKVFGYLPGNKFKKIIMTPEDLAEGWGFLPGLIQKKTDRTFEVFDKGNRHLTSDAIKGYGEHKGDNSMPDILCLQEVESLETLRTFNNDHLSKHYKYAVLVDSHDPRLIDVGILSTYPIRSLVTHVDDPYEGELTNQKYLFSRDCLEARFDILGKSLTVFVNHLKSQLATGKTAAERAKQKLRADTLRKEQAQKVRDIVRQRFPDDQFGTENFVVLGDFNDTPDSLATSPITQELGMTDVIARLDADQQWTHWWDTKNTVSHLDHMLISPNLADNSPDVPYLERRGLSNKRKKTKLETKNGTVEIPFDFERFDGVTDKFEASDHCPVFFDLILK